MQDLSSVLSCFLGGGGGGKKGKKKKGKTVALTEFLSPDGSSTPYIAPARKVDWADESEDPSGEINCKFSVYCDFLTPAHVELFYKFGSVHLFIQPSVHLFIHSQCKISELHHHFFLIF